MHHGPPSSPLSCAHHANLPRGILLWRAAPIPHLDAPGCRTAPGTRWKATIDRGHTADHLMGATLSTIEAGRLRRTRSHPGSAAHCPSVRPRLSRVSRAGRRVGRTARRVRGAVNRVSCAFPRISLAFARISPASTRGNRSFAQVGVTPPREGATLRTAIRAPSHREAPWSASGVDPRDDGVAP